MNIIVPRGTTKKKKMVGRGIGSGHGGTSCKGNNGQNCRSGGKVRTGFEGGQMPLYRRVARRGFSNIRFKDIFTIINLLDLEDFEDGTVITKDFLLQTGIVRKKGLPVKLLGDGEIVKKLTIDLDKVSKTAQEKIEKAGGSVIMKTNAKDEEDGK